MKKQDFSLYNLLEEYKLVDREIHGLLYHLGLYFSNVTYPAVAKVCKINISGMSKEEIAHELVNAIKSADPSKKGYNEELYQELVRYGVTDAYDWLNENYDGYEPIPDGRKTTPIYDDKDEYDNYYGGTPHGIGR